MHTPYRRSFWALSAQAGLLATTVLLPALARADDTPDPSIQATSTAPGTPLAAHAGDFTLKIDTGLVLPLTAPQSELFDMGGGQTVKGMFALTDFLDVGPAIGFVGLPSVAGDAAGTAWTVGGSLQLKRPHHAPDDDMFQGMAPWLDVDAHYVRTGELNRPGFAVGAGVLVPIGDERVFWVGPFARYQQIVQVPERDGFDNHDAKMLTIGLTLEVGPGVRREPERMVAAPAPAPVEIIKTVTTEVTKEVTKEVFVCADADQDGVPDTVDNCPEVVGVAEAWGCPAYQKVVVQKTKLELKDNLYFAQNRAILQPASFPVLDDVVQALKDNKNINVQVEGHTSSEGGPLHNQTLSENRARAVVDYLVAHGIAAERLVAKGFASTVPLDTNETAAGRDRNRRVEFNIIPKNGSKS